MFTFTEPYAPTHPHFAINTDTSEVDDDAKRTPEHPSSAKQDMPASGNVLAQSKWIRVRCNAFRTLCRRLGERRFRCFTKM